MSSGPLDYKVLANQMERDRGRFFRVSDDPMDPIHGPHVNVWSVYVLEKEALKSSYVMSLPFSREEIEESKSWGRVAVKGQPVYWELDPSVPVEKIEGRRVKYPPKGLRSEKPWKEWYEQAVMTRIHQAAHNVPEIETVYKGKSEKQVRDILKQKLTPRGRGDRTQLSSGQVHSPKFDDENGVKFWIGTDTGYGIKKTSWKPQALLVDDWDKSLKTNGRYQLRDYMKNYYPSATVFGKLIRDETGSETDFVLKPDSFRAGWGSHGIDGWFGKEGFFLGVTPD